MGEGGQKGLYKDRGKKEPRNGDGERDGGRSVRRKQRPSVQC